MELNGDNVKLNRGDRAALNVPEKFIAATTIGEVWRDAQANISEQRERLEGAVAQHSAATTQAVLFSNFYRSPESFLLGQVRRKERRLGRMAHMVATIDWETI